MSTIGRTHLGTALSVLLVGCGGGGGGGEAPPTDVTPTVTVLSQPAVEKMSNDFVAPDVAFGGQVSVSGAKTVSVILKPVCDGVSITPTTQTIDPTGGTFSISSQPPLLEGVTCEVVVKVVATGASGHGTERGYVLRVQVAAASDKVPAYRNIAVAAYDGSPVVLSRIAPFVLEVTNRTGLSGQWGMGLGEEPTQDGHILVLSRWFSENSALRVTKVNPVTRVQTAYVGSLPPGYEFNATGDDSTWTWGPKWHWCQSASCQLVYGGPWGSSPESSGYYSAWAPDGEGGYFNAPSERYNELWYLDGTGVSTLLMPGSRNQAGGHKIFTVMHTYSYTPTSP